jgi:hypothetical protein
MNSKADKEVEDCRVTSLEPLVVARNEEGFLTCRRSESKTEPLSQYIRMVYLLILAIRQVSINLLMKMPPC